MKKTKPEGATLLRIMTPKSTIKGGKYEGMLVGDLQRMGVVGVDQIARMYYKYSMISFCKEILDEIGIVDDLVVKKPGSNPKMWFKWRNRTQSDKDWLERYNKLQRDKKTERQNFYRESKTKYSKGNMQRRNHGHK